MSVLTCVLLLVGFLDVVGRGALHLLDTELVTHA